MEYYICSEIKMKCHVCYKQYSLQVKDKKQIDIFNITCDCGGKCREINEYGHFEGQ